MCFRPISSDDLRNALIFGTTTACSAQTCMSKCQTRVAPAQVSDTAQAKARTKRTAEGDPVHSFRTLLANLATVTRNTVAPRLPGTEPFEVITRPTPLQDKALKLLGVRLSCSQ